MPLILVQVLSNFFRIAKDFFVICICLCHTVMSVSCSGVVICWERAYILALLYVIFSCCFFCHFPMRCHGSDVVLDCIDS